MIWTQAKEITGSNQSYFEVALQNAKEDTDRKQSGRTRFFCLTRALMGDPVVTGQFMLAPIGKGMTRNARVLIENIRRVRNVCASVGSVLSK